MTCYESHQSHIPQKSVWWEPSWSVERWTNRHDESNRHFSQLSEHAQGAINKKMNLNYDINNSRIERDVCLVSLFECQVRNLISYLFSDI